MDKKKSKNRIPLHLDQLFNRPDFGAHAQLDPKSNPPRGRLAAHGPRHAHPPSTLYDSAILRGNRLMKDVAARNGSATSSSTDSWKSTETMRGPGSLFRGPSRRSNPMSVKTDARDQPETETETDPQISPTSAAPRTATLPSSQSSPNVSPMDHRMSDFGNYRRELAVLETSGWPIPKIQHNPPTALGSPSQVAPWMSTHGTEASPSSAFGTSFYNDSSDNLSQGSQLSPGLRPGTGLTGNTNASDFPADIYLGDERRPSLASVTTASSQGSKSSVSRQGIRKKLQTFFGEDFPGREGSDTSLPPLGNESYSFARSHRERNLSSATDKTQRDASPGPSRPRTPVPSSDVVPFLYQDSQDIPKYGEAPVRETMSGPDKGRYTDEGPPVPAKNPLTARSGHANLPSHSNRYNQNSEDARVLRPSISREDSAMSTRQKERAPTSMGMALGTASNASLSKRPSSPTPSGMNSWGGKSGAARVGANDGSTSPTAGTTKRRILGRFRKFKEEAQPRMRELPGLPGSPRSFNTPPLTGKTYGSPEFGQWGREYSVAGSEVNLLRSDNGQYARPSGQRQGTLTRLPFRKGRSRATDEAEIPVDQSDRGGDAATSSIFNLDTNLSNMEGILAKAPPLTPLDNNIFVGNVEDEAKVEAAGAGVLGWNAPDSWAVKKVNDDNMSRLSEIDEAGVPPKNDAKAAPFCIRIFRVDGTFVTLSTPLNSTVSEVMSQVGKKTYMTESFASYQIVMKKHDLQRILGPGERPVVIQRRLLEQAGYEANDRIEDVGREDNSYLCRFSFVPSRESGYATVTNDPGVSRVQKYSHVDLSGRNLITIPISLYSKASEIISLNLSRNLSLDLPKDFIQSCQNLRDIKFINNEAWKLPPSLSCASRLTILDVSNNRLEQLEHAELAKLPGLISLKLANNRLRSLPTYFGGFKSMRTLNISSNFLDSFPEFLCDLEGLVDIDMSFNSIASLPDEIGKLRNLERFVMTNNRLNGALPATFGELTNMKEVDIRYNALSSIDVIARLPKVEQISADHNSVSVCESEFTKIRVLRLNSNPVTKFEILNSVPTLTTLILSNAKLAHIPDAAFEKMPNLIKLVLDKNHFVSLPSHIGKLRKLEHFSIARNSLSSLPPEIGCLTEMRFLDVRENNLKKLPMEIWWASKLETLNISSNVLDTFPKPASRAPQVPGENPATSQGLITSSPGQTSSNPSYEELGPLEAFGQRRPSQASSGLLSVGGSPIPGGSDRKSSLVSVYGKGGRKTSIVSRSTSQDTIATQQTLRKDSGMSARLLSTFAGSLRHLYLADNQLDDDVFDELALLGELRILNISYNDINDMPVRTIKAWPQLMELYLSGNEMASLPADDIEEFSLLQVLHINGNKFQTLPAELGKAHRLAVLDCGSNSLKYNVSNWPYDWNWNWNTNLRYLNLSGNKRLEIKPSTQNALGGRDARDLTDFSALQQLRILGLMDVTLTIPTTPDETEDRRVRTSGSLAGQLAYGMADTLGRNEHLSIIDMVVPRFNSTETETLLGMFDGQALSSGGSKIAKYLHENFTPIFSEELKKVNATPNESPIDALRRAFLSLNKDLATAATQHTEERSLLSHRGSAAPAVLSQADLHSGGVATVLFLQQSELYIANVGDAQAMLIHSEGSHRMLTRKHDPAEPNERQRIRDAGGWVSRQGKLNDILEVSRAFGYVQLMPAVQAAPHITQVTVKEQDEMILIASRELWEYLSPELVVDIARLERGDLMRAAQRLRDYAIAFGATNKLMVMMIGVSDLKKRAQIRPHRVQSLSFNPAAVIEDLGYASARRMKRKETVEDSGLRRLQAEVPAPVGDLSIVFTDIKSSTLLWETYPSAMRSAIKLHNEVMRRQLRIIGGYEVKTEGDAFMVSFPTATSALLWCFAVQQALLEVQWPSEVLSSFLGQEVFDNDHTLIFKGLSVRMGIHWGAPVCEHDPVTRRMDYFGPMVNRASRISSVADGGQITVSADFISEIQRCLETYSESDRSGSTGSEDTFDNDMLSQSIRRELRSLSSQGFEVKDLGERKLKGLENPEYIYLMYPHALSGRIHYQQRIAETDKVAQAAEPAALSQQTQLSINTDCVWALWNVSLRLEMLCSSLETEKGQDVALQPAETALLEMMKNRGGEITDRFLVNFLTHQVSRIETCISTLATRHLVVGKVALTDLNQLRGSMEDVMGLLESQLTELARYKAHFGDLPPERRSQARLSTRSSVTMEKSGIRHLRAHESDISIG
ncbi:adenylate cyclase [Marssonina coronariae]|uniref:Adenylate cyclase n=1 Tax=Diplocarpon coronariae TaxID=2795749 RepID=A0A218Z9I4_9HELO|nr:adenylate cyclase [Marssonina coronariae]